MGLIPPPPLAARRGRVVTLARAVRSLVSAMSTRGTGDEAVLWRQNRLGRLVHTRAIPPSGDLWSTVRYTIATYGGPSRFSRYA